MKYLEKAMEKYFKEEVKKTRKRTTEEKRAALARILDYVRTKKTVTAKDIEKIANLTPRQAYNYLYDLEALGLIVYNDKMKCWQPAELQQHKIEYKTKADYELALEHSRRLLFSGEGGQHFDLVVPHNWVKMLAFPEYWGLGQDWLKLVLDHIKTGYEDLWLLIEKYRKTRTEWAKLYGFDPSKDQPVLKVAKPDSSPAPPFISIRPWEEESKKERHEWRLTNPTLEPANMLGYKQPQLSLEQQKREKELSAEMDKLSEEIVTRLSAIMFQVEHGAPLRGQCDFCPTKYVTIKNET